MAEGEGDGKWWRAGGGQAEATEEVVKVAASGILLGKLLEVGGEGTDGTVEVGGFLGDVPGTGQVEGGACKGEVGE